MYSTSGGAECKQPAEVTIQGLPATRMAYGFTLADAFLEMQAICMVLLLSTGWAAAALQRCSRRSTSSWDAGQCAGCDMCEFTAAACRGSAECCSRANAVAMAKQQLQHSQQLQLNIPASCRQGAQKGRRHSINVKGQVNTTCSYRQGSGWEDSHCPQQCQCGGYRRHVGGWPVRLDPQHPGRGHKSPGHSGGPSMGLPVHAAGGAEPAGCRCDTSVSKCCTIW